MDNNETNVTGKALRDRIDYDVLGFVLVGLGLIVFPIALRSVMEPYMHNYAWLNFFALFAMIAWGIFGKKYEGIDRIYVYVYLFLFLLLFPSLYAEEAGPTLTFLFNCFVPGLMIIHRFEKDKFKTMIRYVLLVFDIFICVLLINAVIDKVTGGAIILYLDKKLDSYLLYFLAKLVDSGRFASLWGHPLTNALFFNMFFVINDMYYRAINKKYPKLLFLIIAAGGVLLCAGKTAIVVLVCYFLVSSYKDWKLLALSAVAGVAAFALGGLDMIISRFKGGDLTTGRIPTLKKVFELNQYPFMVWRGYGTAAVFDYADYNWAKPAFEFPLLMHALDYGIVFSVVFIGGIFIYISYRMLKNKDYMSWIGFSLIFAQINTYNGICLRNQDIFIWFSLFAMLVLNISDMRSEER